MNKEIYLDNSATTRPYDGTVDVAVAHLTDYYNPSAIYRSAIEVSKKIETVRKLLLKSINGSQGTLIFTSGGTESINSAIIQNTRKDMSVVSTAYEHDATIKSLEKLEQDGIQVIRVKPQGGKIDIDEIISQMDNKTSMVSVMHVNNETGHIIDIEALGRAIKEKNQRTAFHVDAVQSYMKMKIDVQAAMIDFLSLSSHKIHGIKGTGALYIRNPERFKLLIYGGGQEQGYRSGTENVSGILALGKAVEIGLDNFDQNIKHLKALRHYFLENLSEIDDLAINSPEDSAPHILNVSFLGVPSEILLHTLEASGICVSSGSACSSKKKASRSLEALGIGEMEKKSAIRFSFSGFNTISDLDDALEIIKKSVKSIREITKYKIQVR